MIIEELRVEISQIEKDRIVQCKIEEVFSELRPILGDFFTRGLYGEVKMKIEAGNLVQLDDTIKKRY